MTSVAIVVPGIMGSELRLGDEVIWPGPLRALWLTTYGQMKELLRDDLVATDLIRNYTIFSVQYQALLDDLARCGFREDDNPPTLFTFPYDWRKRNEVAAEGLADRIDRVAQIYAGETEISLIAHSMGGLVSRYYLESGDFNARPGFKRVIRLITIGTPHRGASAALPRLLGMEKVLWLNKSQVRTLVSDPRFPAAYQLLPPCGEPFAWDERSGSEYGEVDVYDEPIATQLKLVAESLQAAQRFHARLDFTKRPNHVRYFCFGGTQQRTVAYVRLMRDGATATFRVRGIELDGGGDGTVPVWSSTLSGLQSLPVGGEHSTLYKNAELRRTLAVLLGAPGVLADRIEIVELSVRERVVEPMNPLHVVLKFGPNINDIDGELRVEIAEEPQPDTISYRPVKVSPIRYQGLEAETFSVVLEAPEFPGPYRVAFYANSAPRPAGSDDFFVQTP